MALAVGLVAAPMASATADPASGGTFKLKLNSSFKNQLKNNHVSMKPKSFTISGGSLDPTTGAGKLTLTGKLKFKNKRTGKKAVFKSLEATFGSGKLTGKLGGSRKTIAKFTSDGTVARSGFDSSITGVKAKFKAAKSVNKKLDLNSLKNKKMGKVSNTTVFSSLSVVSGTASLLIDTGSPPPGSPPLTAIEKFGAKGVQGAGSVAPTGNATLGAGPSLNFPTVTGNVRPDGTFGQLNTAGGVKFTKKTAAGDNNATTCANTGHPVNTFVQLDNIRIDLESKTASADVVTPIGPIGRLNVADLSGGAFTADSAARTVSFSGVHSALTSTSPTLLGQIFGTEAQGCGPSAGGATDFSGGESVGDLSGSVQTQ